MSAIGPDRVPPLPGKKPEPPLQGSMGAKTVTYKPSDGSKVARFFLKVGRFLLFPLTVPLKLLERATYISALRPLTLSEGSAEIKQQVLGGKLDRLGTSILKVFAKIFDQQRYLQEIQRKEALFSILDAADKMAPGFGNLIQKDISELFYLSGGYKMQRDIEEVLTSFSNHPFRSQLIKEQKELFILLLGEHAKVFHEMFDPYGSVP